MTGGWIGVDLDGTLAHYERWVSETDIGAPIAPMVARVRAWLAAGKDVRIFTARAFGLEGEARPEAIAAIEAWCLEHLGAVLRITCRKDFQMVCLYDDRCRQVEENTGRLVGEGLRDALAIVNGQQTELSGPPLEQLVKDAMDRVALLSPEQQQAMWEEQKRSWVRGEMALKEADREMGHG